MEHQGIWLIVDYVDGASTENSLELVTPGRQLADQLGQPLTAVVLVGSGSDPGKLGAYGVDNVITLQHELLGTYQGELFTKALSDLILDKKPNIVLFTGSTMARDYAPRVAVRTGGGLASMATQLTLNGQQQLEATKACYAEALLSSVVTGTARPQMATVRAKAYEKPAIQEGRTASVETINPALSADQAHSKLVNVVKPEVKGKKLEEAEVIVSGGRGLKGPENFHIVEELAEVLGAAVGASRAVVDAGWRPHSEQVGQTGKTVSPKVYIALGIHGAIQHLVGMNSSLNIIAVNSNPDAPIFTVADFGVVGDALQIGPLLTKTLKERNLVGSA